ncbi:MAG: hypothetical protein F7B20_07575 [Aeropyrum sp.]|nr:hypothetical protein [Aeropyrum sp.]
MERFRVALSAPILGVPVPDSENPVLASPIGEVLIGVGGSNSCEAYTGRRDLDGIVSSFSENLYRGLELRGCARVEVLEGGAGSPPLSLYAAVTSSLVYWVASSHGEDLQPLEIVELARLSDPMAYDRSWQPVLDAVRMSASRGDAVVYRNEEESAYFKGPRLRVSLAAVERVKPRISRESVGGDAYNALVHLAGIAVLEAAVRVREGDGLAGVVRDMKPLQEGLALAVWGVAPYGEDCVPIPDMPGSMSVVCIEDGG